MSSTLALDIILKALISSPDFCSTEDKHWDAVSRLVPGVSADQCERRYRELLAVDSTHVGIISEASAALVKGSTTAENGKDRRLSSSRVKSNKAQKQEGVRDAKHSSTGTGMPNSEQSPIMVIHVCDEAKNLKQDFTCPRDLLVHEMRYFAEYLSTDSQRMEEVDISVHCDIQIFDWLMKYVKRTTRESNGAPSLEAGNVVSILISSDFLKMDTLVNECIEYCRQNMSAIIATPCNMNCIDDRLVTRISELFDHNELDAIKDRKDKFKSKLFAKKVEKLFEANAGIPGSPENASTLFRCYFCKKILTKNLVKRVRCLQSRMTIDRYGKFTYSHLRDPSWDASDWLLEARNQLKTWSDVYWHVWGTINHLDCARCGETFSCVELANCRYHPEAAVFDTSKPAGEYQCCGLKVLRFDPLQPNQGCRLRDHIVKLQTVDGTTDKPDAKLQVYQDLLAHRDVVCLPFLRSATILNDDADINIFAADEIATGVLQPSQVNGSTSNQKMTMNDFRSDLRFPARNKMLMADRELTYDDRFDGESDDEVGDDEEVNVRLDRRSSKITQDPQTALADTPGFNASKTTKWDASRSLRYNQDAQREEDLRRMREIVAYLTRIRLPADKMEKLKQREYAGGIFSKLEAQWKAANMPPPKPSNPAFRSKPRLGPTMSK